MGYITEKQEGLNCTNYNCKFWDVEYEQNCSAGDEYDNPAIMACDKYIPEHDGA